MTLRPKDCVARIIARDGERWLVATGCAVGIGPNKEALVLTTRHRLFDGAASITDLEIRIGSLVETTYTVEWQCQYCDLVLLRCGQLVPRQIARIGALAADNTTTLRYWAAGYPRAGKQEDHTRKLVELSGELYLGLAAQPLLELGVDYAPSEIDDWAGASGSPVFVDGALVAMIRDVPRAFDGRRIDAIALDRVLQLELELARILKANDYAAPVTSIELARRGQFAEALSLIQQMIFETPDVNSRVFEQLALELDWILKQDSPEPSIYVNAQRLRNDVERILRRVTRPSLARATTENHSDQELRRSRSLRRTMSLPWLAAFILIVLCMLIYRQCFGTPRQLSVSNRLNAMFPGYHGWFCLPDNNEKMIGIKRIPDDYRIDIPITQVDMGDDNTEVHYRGGERVPFGTGATGHVSEGVLLPNCPDWQHAAIDIWQSQKLTSAVAVNGELLDVMLKVKWQCHPRFSFAVKADLREALELAYPFTGAEGADHLKYGVGESVPPGDNVTLWLAGNLAACTAREAR